MIHTRDHKTGYIFDPWHFLGQKRRKLMDTSWAALFREHILCELPVSKVVPFFDETFGRPTKELYTALGVLLLQQIHDLTDEETVSQLAFNLQWHYALDIVDESDEAKYLCAKTLWNMRDLVIEIILMRSCLIVRPMYWPKFLMWTPAHNALTRRIANPICAALAGSGSLPRASIGGYEIASLRSHWQISAFRTFYEGIKLV